MTHSTVKTSEFIERKIRFIIITFCKNVPYSYRLQTPTIEFHQKDFDTSWCSDSVQIIQIIALSKIRNGTVNVACMLHAEIHISHHLRVLM